LFLSLIASCAPTTGSALPSASPGNQPGAVTPKTERAGEVSYRLFAKPEAVAANRKGLVLIGAGNNESDPSTGSLDGGLENAFAQQLAQQGYVAAIVAYRDQPPVNFQDGGESWNRNTAMLATDMSNVANAVIASQGGGLTRARVLTGGVSYTSYALLTNIAMNDSPLADTKGVLAACGSTGDFEAKNFKVPVFSLVCSGNPEGDFSGQALIDRITNPQIKAESGAFVDAACNSHCGGSNETWSAKLLERTKIWLP
jgi:hypothetical protein